MNNIFRSSSESYARQRYIYTSVKKKLVMSIVKAIASIPPYFSHLDEQVFYERVKTKIERDENERSS